jgi:hypothetical protein
MTSLTRNLVAIILVLCAGVLLFAQSPATRRLIQLLNTPEFLEKVVLDIDDAAAAGKELLHAAIDAGPAAVSELRNLLQHSNGELKKTGPVLGDRPSPELLKKGFALIALVMIGGSETVSILQDEYKNGYKEAAVGLASTLASSDSPRSRAMLTGFLAQDPEDEDELTAAAAYSLGLLRVPEALPRLRVLARGSADRETTEAAKLAVQWIEKGFSTIASQPNDDRQAVLAAILKVGIPDGTHAYFFDPTGGGFWRYSPAGWTFARGNPQERSSGPEVDDVFLSSDSSRAFVSISTNVGEFGYSLRKDGGEWKVQMLITL